MTIDSAMLGRKTVLASYRISAVEFGFGYKIQGLITMQETAIALAILDTVLTNYVFSFQQFTLGIARGHTDVTSEVTEIQILMTPTLIGAAGWACSVLWVVASVLLGVAYFWWVGVAYFIVELYVLRAIHPLLPFKRHFAGMARRELQSHMAGPAAAFAAVLIRDVDRADTGGSV